MYPRKLTRSIISNPDYPVVQTKAGKLRGLWEEGVFLFRGVQYAQAKRFHLAEPVEPWEGTKDAIIYGPVCKEIHTPIAHDEYNVPHYRCCSLSQCADGTGGCFGGAVYAAPGFLPWGAGNVPPRRAVPQ